jgi:hypothetical protein
VVATLRERNSVVFHDNDFEVFLDADGCNHNYYELEVNAFNTIWELRLDKPYKNGGSEHSERVGMKGQGNLPNLRTVVSGPALSRRIAGSTFTARSSIPRLADCCRARHGCVPCAVDGRLNDASFPDVGWGLVARIPFSDLKAAGHCASAPAPLDRWSLPLLRAPSP